MKETTGLKAGGERISISVSLPDGNVCSVITNEFRYAVWQTLKAVNTKLNRLVPVTETTRAYIESKNLITSPVEFRRLTDAVGNALRFFVRHNLIFAKKQNKRQIYGCVDSIDPNSAAINEPPLPLRHKLLAMVRQTVTLHGRAVRGREVIEYANTCGITELSERQITNNLWSLVAAGELKITGRMRGDGYGRTLFLPSETNLSELHGVEKLVFADLVMRALNQLWEEQIAEAEISGDSIRPFSTAAIRERVNQMPETNLFCRRRGEITSVLNHLADKSVPEVRAYAQSNRLRLWAPVTFEDKEIDFKNTYSSNALKIRAAIERAYLKAGKRPVTTREINREISADKNLTLTGYVGVSQYLSVLTQQQKSTANEKVNGRKYTPQIRSLGLVGNFSYYAPLESSEEESIAYVEFQRLKRQWKELHKVENLPLILNCQLETARIGRTQLFLQEIQPIIEKLFSTKNELTNHERQSLYEELTDISEQLSNILKAGSCGDLPEEVAVAARGLIPAEAVEFLAPFYPVAERIKKDESVPANVIGGRTGSKFYRIPNSEFVAASSKIPRCAAKYLFDFTGMMMTTALEWGGDECRHQAFTAKQELGVLRDDRFIAPALESLDFEQRLAGIACLAFLQKEQDKLCKLACNDPVAEVQQAALWAYAFAHGADYQHIAQQISEQSTNSAVVKFAVQISQTNSQSEIWQM